MSKMENIDDYCIDLYINKFGQSAHRYYVDDYINEFGLLDLIDFINISTYEFNNGNLYSKSLSNNDIGRFLYRSSI